MAIKICKCFYKVYNPNSVLSLSSSIFLRLISLFKDFNKFFKPLILFVYLIFILNTLFLTLSTIKYIEKNLQRIFKIVLKA